MVDFKTFPTHQKNYGRWADGFLNFGFEHKKWSRKLPNCQNMRKNFKFGQASDGQKLLQELPNGPKMEWRESAQNLETMQSEHFYERNSRVFIAVSNSVFWFRPIRKITATPVVRPQE